MATIKTWKQKPELPKTPFKAVIVHTSQTGADSWEDTDIPHIVWAICGNRALVSMEGSSYVTSVHTDVLQIRSHKKRIRSAIVR